MEENKNPTAQEEVTESAQDAEVESEEKAAPKHESKKAKKLAELEAQLEKITAELDEANAKYMRLYAEYDNFRRRTQKEKEGIYSDAYIDALTQILPVLDNLERATQFCAEDEDSPMAKGLSLTLKSFTETMTKLGVSEIPALGEKFDPNVHNAVMHAEDDAFGENEITEVFMKGYIRGDKVLRHSMVKVVN